MNNKLIGIIGAMDIEITEIKSAMTDVKETSFMSIDFFEGKLMGKPVVLAKCGVGKVNSAICVTVMAMKFSPYLIINPGVSGGVGKGVLIGDMVIASSCVQHDMDTSLVGDPVALMTIAGKDMVNIPCSEKYSKIFFDESKKIYDGNIFNEVIASGDQFIADPKKVMEFRENYNAYACDMESASMAHACLMAGVEFVALRSISDNANESGGVDFMEFAKKSAKKSMQLLNNCIALI